MDDEKTGHIVPLSARVRQAQKPVPRPDYDAISACVTNAILRKEVTLPSGAFTVADLTIRSLKTDGDFPGDAHILANIVQGEINLIAYYISALVNGRNAPHVLNDEEGADFTPAMKIDRCKTDLAVGYQSLGMARSGGESEKYLTALHALAQQLAKARYPQFVHSGVKHI